MNNIQTFLLENNLPQPRSIKKLSESVYNDIISSTSFLSDVQFGYRVYCAYHNVKSIPKCSVCGNYATFGRDDSVAYGRYAFSKWCSNKCASKDSVKKRQQTCLELYGAAIPAKLNQFKEKSKQTNIKRYGVESYSLTDEFAEKVKQTSLSNYGVEHHAASDNTKEKRKQNLLKTHGVENVFQLDSVKKKIVSSLLSKHGVENPQQSKEIREKTYQTNLVRYGVKHPLQNQEILDKLKQTNIERYGHPNFMSCLIDIESHEILRDREKLQVVYNQYECLRTVASVLGIGSHRTIFVAMTKHGIQTKDKKSFSLAEKEISSFLTENGIRHRIKDRDILSPKEIDIVIDDHMLGIEYNGMYWHSDSIRSDKLFHQNKVLDAKDKGYKLIHIFEDQWSDPIKKELFKEKILRHCGKSSLKRVYARQCSIIELDDADCVSFYNKHHIQGHINSLLNYALVHDDEVVAILSFKTQDSSSFYLTRYATSCNVIGGFSKLMKHFERNNQFDSVYTFTNLDYATGDMYLQYGFEKMYITSPNYFYYDGERHSRQKFMKHKQKDRLELFDENLSEYQNMIMNGFIRLYDSGSIKFVYKSKH